MISVIICGGRNYRLTEKDQDLLSALHRFFNFGSVIHGDARGVDRDAKKWAEDCGIPTKAEPVKKWENDWDGCLRNQRMIERPEKPSMVIAFTGSSGTDDMVTRAWRCGLRVIDLRPRQKKASYNQEKKENTVEYLFKREGKKQP